jgi:hypothetical protein
MPETMGPGVIVADFNGDGLSDIVVPNGRSFSENDPANASSRLYINRGEFAFSDESLHFGLDRIRLYAMGGAAADIDGDGDTDLILSGWGGIALLVNQGGSFRDKTTELGLPGYLKFPVNRDSVPYWSTSVAIFDVDGDRDLDLLSSNYVSWSPATDIYTTMDGKNKSFATPDVYEGQAIKLYLNEPRGYRDVSEAWGLSGLVGKALGLALWDFDKDGDLDVFVANDKVGNFLLQNQGDRFTDVALAAGVAYDENGSARAGMGVDIADIGNNGGVAVTIGNFSGEPTSLFEQRSAFQFREISRQSRIFSETLSALTFGIVFVDMDMDGWQDILSANGHIEPGIDVIKAGIRYRQQPLLLKNDGAGRFVNISDKVALDDAFVGRGLAVADFDRDGDYDPVFTASGDTLYLYRNDVTKNRWIGLELEGTPPNTDAIGAQITVRSGELVQRRTVRTGSSYMSQSSFAEVFGLPQETTRVDVTIRWPDGRVEQVNSLGLDRYWQLTESRAAGLVGGVSRRH